MTKPVKRKDGGFEEKTKKIKPKRQAAKSIREKVESLVGANLKDAKRKDGQPSQGQMKRKDGSTFGLMGDDLLKKQARRDKIEGGLKTAGVGALLLGADKAGDYKDKKQADKKAAKEKESKKLTPFEAAFKAAADSGKKTFTFKGKRYNTDRTTGDPKVLRKAVEKKAVGGLASGTRAAKQIVERATKKLQKNKKPTVSRTEVAAASATGGVVLGTVAERARQNRNRPAGVGQAQRGFGKAMNKKGG